MRCGCPDCGTYMVHSEARPGCVCPACTTRCSDCMGTNTLITREAIDVMKRVAAREDEGGGGYEGDGLRRPET